ncbi:hypothetical protein SOVF_166160, partial [Spinacia oleracea]
DMIQLGAIELGSAVD